MNTTTTRTDAEAVAAFPASQRTQGETTSSSEGTRYVDFARLHAERGTGSPAVKFVVDLRKAPSKRLPKVLRRFRGVLLSHDASDARVLLSLNGVTCEYCFPIRQLNAAGIKHQNQPFEMDEVESIGPNSSMLGYVFKPLGDISSAFLDQVELSAELKVKRSAIFKRFGNPKC